MGDIACIDTETGEKKWGLNMIEKFKGKNTRFGYSQSLEIDGDLVYCAPGGEDVNIVALDRFTGETKWTNKVFGEVPAYCSPTILEFPTRNVLVTFSDNALFGLESTTGKLLWSHMQDTICDIHGNTPIYENGHLYYVTGCGNGTVKLQISEDGSQITEVWRNKKLDNMMGGAVKVNDKIFASGHRKKKWKAIDTNSGEMVDSLKFGRGATIAANGLLYCYNEQGKVALVKTEPKMEIISQFRVKKGTKEHFAQPVINKGILYIRHGNVVLAYDIKVQG
jgi:outer membrane protein assembly factor BamB